MRQHHLEQLPVETLRPRLDLSEVETRLQVQIVGAGAVLKIKIDEQVGGLASRCPLLRRMHRALHRDGGDAASADGRQEGVDLRLGRGVTDGTLATRAQARTSSTADTGLTRKSATRICISLRARFASTLRVTTTTGGHVPRAPIRLSSACSSSCGRIEIDHHDGRGLRIVSASALPACRGPGGSICALAAKVGAPRSVKAGVRGHDHHLGLTRGSLVELVFIASDSSFLLVAPGYSGAALTWSEPEGAENGGGVTWFRRWPRPARPPDRPPSWWWR